MSKAVETSLVLNRNADACVGIVVALPEELRTLTAKKLEQGECYRLGNIWIAYSGAGHDNAGKAAQTLLDKGVQGLISWGCAAGLTERFKPGDLLIAEQAINAQQQFDIDVSWRNHILNALNPVVSIHNGKLYTANTLISRSQEKRQIHRTSQAVALDMESAAIGAVATQANAPFLVIRSIADPVTMDLPAAVLAGLNQQGQVELSKLLLHLLCHPWEAVGLIRLGLHFFAAQKTLRIVAKQLGLQDSQPAPIAN